MDANCRSFCPIAELCVQQYEVVQNTLAIDQQQELESQDSVNRIADSLSLSEAAITVERLALDMIKNGTYEPPGGIDKVLDTSLDSLNEHNEKIKENIPLLEERMKHHSLKQAALAASRLAVQACKEAKDIVEAAQNECTGPRLTWTGRLKYGKAVLQAWFFADHPRPPEANKRYLFKKGYIACSGIELADLPIDIGRLADFEGSQTDNSISSE